MAKAYVSMGSNIDPAENVRKGVILLASRVRILSISTVYMTPPIGRSEQDWYYNCAVEIETEERSPVEVKSEVLRPIEGMLGRRRTADAYAPRTIDLDLILYDDLAGRFDDLTLPDPDIFERPFLAACLSELAPDLLIPGTDTTADQVSEKLGKEGLVELQDYSESLRKEVGDAVRYTQDRVSNSGTHHRARRRSRP